MTIPQRINDRLAELERELPTLAIARRQGLQIFAPYIILNDQNLHVMHSARIDSLVKIECGLGTCIGEFVHVASFAHLGIGGGILIAEDGTAFASGCRVVTGSNTPGRGHGCSAIDPRASSSRSFVHVKRNAVLYVNAVVLPGITIGENAVVAAGAIVTKDVPAFEQWAGVPARKVGDVGR